MPRGEEVGVLKEDVKVKEIMGYEREEEKCIGNRKSWIGRME